MEINNHTVWYYILNSNKHRHTLTTLTGLAFLAGPSWTMSYELIESYCTYLHLR